MCVRTAMAYITAWSAKLARLGNGVSSVVGWLSVSGSLQLMDRDIAASTKPLVDTRMMSGGWG
jgi:hypothetical protein